MPRAKFRRGETVSYGGYPMTVAIAVELDAPPDPSESPGYYYGLRTPDMPRGLYLFAPEWEVTAAVELDARAPMVA
jgi:hypothetical protein